MFLSLTNESENEILSGIQNLGKCSFSNNVVLSKAKIFLKAKIETLDNNKNGKEKLNRILNTISEVLNTDRPYSPWLKYLSSNLESVGVVINKEILSQKDFWNTNPISSKQNRTDSRMVLIPGNEEIKPFFLGVTETTNKDYFEFLESNEFDKEENGEECLGHYWLRKEVFGKGKNHDNPYLDIINYYHIIFWTDDKIPKGRQDHPVVWISWFAAAKFCNWLSRRENLPLYYKFSIQENKFINLTVNKGSYGYRLPSENEWRFAASGGDLNAETILDIYANEKDKERIRRKYFADDIETTSSVKSENPNKFGVYGLMGNVREWVDNPENELITKYDEQIIKGMGWLLGEEGFKFSHSSPLISQNNNVDVGFRIARSLTDIEEQKVKSAYSTINKK